MTRTATMLLGTAFALGLSGAANAQSSGAMDPATMTCADLAAMGQEQVQGALDTIASAESLTITGTTGTSAPATGTTSGSSGSTSTGTDTTAGAATGTTGTTGTSGSGSSSDTTTAGTSGATTGTTGSSESSSGDTATAGAATGTTGTSGSTSSESSTMAAGSLDQMQIDEIMTVCAESPDRLVSDVYREHSAANQ